MLSYVLISLVLFGNVSVSFLFDKKRISSDLERNVEAPVCCSPWREGCTWTCWRRWRSRRARWTPPATHPPSSPPSPLAPFLSLFPFSSFAPILFRVLLHLTTLCQQLLQQIFIWNKEILLRFGTNTVWNYLKQLDNWPIRSNAQSLFFPAPIEESAWGHFFPSHEMLNRF